MLYLLHSSKNPHMFWLIREINLGKQAAVTSLDLSAGCLQSRIEILKEITCVNWNGHLSAKAQRSSLLQ